MSTNNDGGPAYPQTYRFEPESHRPDGTIVPAGRAEQYICHGMSLRDWFAGTMQEDDRLVKCIRAMDDTALLMFATNPTVERDEWITETGDLCGANVFAGKAEVEKVVIRLKMEAAAIARVRYMQADAMLAQRNK